MRCDESALFGCATNSVEIENCGLAVSGPGVSSIPWRLVVGTTVCRLLLSPLLGAAVVLAMRTAGALDGIPPIGIISACRVGRGVSVRGMPSTRYSTWPLSVIPHFAQLLVWACVLKNSLHWIARDCGPSMLGRAAVITFKSVVYWQENRCVLQLVGIELIVPDVKSRRREFATGNEAAPLGRATSLVLADTAHCSHAPHPCGSNCYHRTFDGHNVPKPRG
jgi:hypothetical protein